MGFPRQVYWSELPFPPPGDLPDPGIESMSPASPALIGGFFTTESLGIPLAFMLSEKNLPLVCNHWDCLDLQSLCLPIFWIS